MEFTREQQQVIDQRDKNILVPAAAGSGKTAVLTERILQMVKDEAHPVDIDRLLVVTFTRAAAAEMRERVFQKIAAALKENPTSEHLQKQYTLVHRASITTIDSFCLNVVRNHFQEIGLDPDFRMMDEGERKLLEKDVLGALLEEQYASEDPAFLAASDYFSLGADDTRFEEVIAQLHAYGQSFPWPEEELQSRKADFAFTGEEDFFAGNVGTFLVGYAHKMLSGYAEQFRVLLGVCHEPDGPYMNAEILEEEVEVLDRIASLEDWETMGEQLGVFLDNGKRLSTKKDDSVNADKRKMLGDDRKKLKEELRKLSDQLFFASPKEQMELALAGRQELNTLIDLTCLYGQRLQEEKRLRHVVDFSDIEHFALGILLKKEPGKAPEPTEVAAGYRDYFYEIMIDEYQDSNLVQEVLLQSISGEAVGRYNRFMVGDVKQSIYRFRQARPDLFLKKYDTYEHKDGCVRIDLSMNFRSRAQVVNSANDFFRRTMRKELCGLDYDEKAQLYVGASYPENVDTDSEVLLVEDGLRESMKESLGYEPDGNELEARAVAQRIMQLMRTQQVTQGREDEAKLRPVKYSDIVILHRSPSSCSNAYRKVFEQEGIPLSLPAGVGYLSAMEVRYLLQFLRVLDNPLSDVPLYGVLQSIFGGFTDGELALLRAGNKGMPLYESLKQYAMGTGETPTDAEPSDIESSGVRDVALAQKTSVFLQKFALYREKVSFLTVRELLQQICDDYHYLDYVTALPAGAKRRANVEMLFTRASDYESTSYYGLFHFIRYIDQLQKYEVDFGEAQLLDSNADYVQMMSIHGSKGLEFPVAMIVGMGHHFNDMDLTSELVVDTDLGLGWKYVDTKRRIRTRTLPYQAVSYKLRLESRSEELRLFYVALTRAKEKLILVGVTKDAEKMLQMTMNSSAQNLSFQQFISANSQMDFLLPILGKVDFRVSVCNDIAMRTAQVLEQLSLSEKRRALENGQLGGWMEEVQKLQKHFDFEYPRKDLATLYTKTTVSELKMQAMADRDEAAHDMFESRREEIIPAFRSKEQSISGTTRGNAYHRAMEILDFDRVLGPICAGSIPGDFETYERLLQTSAEQLEDEIRIFYKEMQEDKRLKAEYYPALNMGKIRKFLQSELAYRMWRSTREGGLYREQPFVLQLPATLVHPEIASSESVLIQGIIDAYFIEDEQIVLLDYKTDNVQAMQQLYERYETQLTYYQKALQQLTGRKVKEKLLYSFHLDMAK